MATLQCRKCARQFAHKARGRRPNLCSPCRIVEASEKALRNEPEPLVFRQMRDQLREVS